LQSIEEVYILRVAMLLTTGKIGPSDARKEIEKLRNGFNKPGTSPKNLG